jgi:hypothetical protein
MAKATGQIVFTGIPERHARITIDDGQGNGHSQVTFYMGQTVGSALGDQAALGTSNNNNIFNGNASKVVTIYGNDTTNANHVAYLYLNFGAASQDASFFQDISTGGSTPAVLEFKDYDGNTVNVTFVNTSSFTADVTNATHSRKVSSGEYELNTYGSSGAGLAAGTFTNEMLYILQQARTDGDMSLHASTYLRVLSTTYLQIGAESNGISKAPMMVRLKRASGSWSNTSKDVFWNHITTGTGAGYVTAKISAPDEPVYSIQNNSTDIRMYGPGNSTSGSETAMAAYLADIINSMPIQITAVASAGTLSLTNDNHGTAGNTTITSVKYSSDVESSSTTNLSITSFSGGAAESGGGNAMAKRLQISARQIALSGSGGLSGSADAKSALVLDLAGLSAASIAQTDVLAFADADSSNLPKKITFSDFEDAVFGNVSGDATIAAGGALTIANDAVQDAMLNDDVAAGLAGAGLAASSGVMSLDLSEYSDVQIASGDKLLVLDSDGSTEQLESIDDIAALFAGAGMTASSAVMAVVNATNGGLSVNANDINIDLNDLAAAAVDASADSIAIIDATDNSTKKESIADLASAMASGTGIVASGGQFAVDGVLEDLDSLGAASADGEFIVATGAGAFAYESGNTARTSLGLGTGDSPQFTDLTLSGDLTVQGTTTTVDSTVVAIADKAMVLASGSNDSQIAAAGGAGINIAGEGGSELASFLYDGVDSWDLSDHLNMASGQVVKFDGADMLSASGSAKVTSDVAGNGLAHSSGVLSVDASEISDAAVASGDKFVFHDATDDTTKKESIDDIATFMAGDGLAASSGVLSMDASEISDASVASGDKFVFHDATDDSTKKESIDDIATFMAGDALAASSGVLAVQANSTSFQIASDEVQLASGIAGDGLALSSHALELDISEYSDVAVASGDKFLMLDSDGSTHQLESIDDISSFQAGAGLVASSGVLAVVNASNGGLSVNADDVNLDLNDLAAAAVDVGADSVAIIDATDNSTKKESIADIMTAAAGDGLSASSGVLAVDFNEISAADVDASADSFLFVDATDNSTKKESLADYATAIAGDGIAASSGALELDISEYSDVAVASGDKFLMLDSDGSTHQLESIDDISSFQAGDGLQVSSGVMSIVSIEDRFTGSDVAVSGTVGTLSQAPASTGSVFVFVNGMMQSQDYDYALSGTGNTTLTLAGANSLVAADEVVVKYIQA